MASIHVKSKISLRDGFKKIAGIVSNFDQSLASDLNQLGELLFSDVDTGLSQLRDGLPRILKKLKPSEKSNDSAQFFETYELPSGKKLSTDSIHKLIGITSSFPSGTEAEQNEEEFERKYSEDPESFWSLLSRPRDPSDISIIHHISECFNEQGYLIPIRRRIVLSVLFDRVQSELQRIQASRSVLKRGQTFKGVATDTLLNRLWDPTDPATKKKRMRFNRNVHEGGKWARFEPGVLIGLADHQAWTAWERSVNDEELKAVEAYISVLPVYERWKELSPLASRLKSAFLSPMTGADRVAAQYGSDQRKRGSEEGDFQDQNLSQRKRRAKTQSSNAQNTALARSHLQPPPPVSEPHMASNMQVSAEAATTTGPSSNEYSPPVLDSSFINRINNFDISAGHPFIDGTNDFDISAGPRAALQPPPLDEISFIDGINNLDNQTGLRSVPRLSSLGNVPFMDGMNDFDISAGVCTTPQSSFGATFANTSGNFDIPHRGVFDSSSFNRSVNDFDISAGQDDILSRIGCTRLQLSSDISQSQHLVGA